MLRELAKWLSGKGPARAETTTSETMRGTGKKRGLIHLRKGRLRSYARAAA
jgi:hypothetical protein